MEDNKEIFDFDAYGQACMAEYMKHHRFYSDLAVVVERILEESLKRRGIKVQSVQARAKDPVSFSRKAAQPSNSDTNKPKYSDPIKQITDLAAVRIITYFPSTLAEIDEVLSNEFLITERSDKGAELIEEERFGYQSIHYLVRLGTQRSRLPEYNLYAEATVEIQVRTILQHAWAEIEHDIQYKSAAVIPTAIRRRFMSLAGLLEIADREFQAIQDADTKLTEEARSNVKGGQLDRVEITPDALKIFLDERLGPDGRISEFSYDWTARLLKKLGFRTLEQVEKCIRNYDDDHLSRIAANSRRGQTTRFEYMLLAGMGENFITRHLFAPQSWYGYSDQYNLGEFKKHGIEIKGYDPLIDISESNL